MGAITSFEGIVAWQKARELTREIYRLCNTAPLSKDYALADQMRRASVSVMANIAEGYDRSGDGEFRQFLSVAKGSVSEVRSHLYVALDAGLVSKSDFERLQDLAMEIGKLLGAFMRYLRNANLKGSKFRPGD